jgi:hypothetical protein
MREGRRTEAEGGPGARKRPRARKGSERPDGRDAAASERQEGIARTEVEIDRGLRAEERGEERDVTLHAVIILVLGLETQRAARLAARGSEWLVPERELPVVEGLALAPRREARHRVAAGHVELGEQRAPERAAQRRWQRARRAGDHEGEGDRRLGGGG